MILPLGLDIALQHLLHRRRQTLVSLLGVALGVAFFIAISAMMVHTATGENGAHKVRQLLHDRGLEKTIKLVVGGAPYRFDGELYKAVGADAWAADGVNAGKLIVDLIKEVKAS